MGLIVDTHALSAIAEGEPAVATELAASRQFFIPVIVLGEYRFGIAQSRTRREHERWLDEILAEATVLDVDQQTAICYAEIRLQLKRAGTPIPPNDTWIAALSRQHNLPVMSRDGHFDLVSGLRRVDW